MRQPLIRWGAAHIIGAVSLEVLTGPNADAGTACFAVRTDDSVWRTIRFVNAVVIEGSQDPALVRTRLLNRGCNRSNASMANDRQRYRPRHNQ